MNLMFWKKSAGAEAENAQETPETPLKAGLAARARSWLTSFRQRYRKTSTFEAEENQDQNAPDRPEGKSAELEPDLEPAPAGLLARIKYIFSALLRKFKKPVVSEDTEGLPVPAPAGPSKPLLTKKRLIIGAATALLAGIAIWVTWGILNPPESHHGTKHDMTPIVIHDTQTGPATEKHAAGVDLLKEAELEAHNKEKAELEELKKQNAELQARIEALKEKPAQPSVSAQPYIPSALQATGKNSHPSGIGEMTVGNSDPKITAMTLKEAIEAMNANSGEFRKKTAK